LARRQHGVVARAQLREVGLGEKAIELRLARGRLHSLYRGVYAVGHLVLADHGWWMAAVLAGGAGAVLSHRSAAALWGIRASHGGASEVTIDRQLRPRPRLRFHRSYLPPDEVAIHDGIPVTTYPRTLLDLAGVLSRGQLDRAINEAEIRRLWDPLSLADLLARHPRRPGAAALRAVIDEGRARTRSELEDRFIDFLGVANLPRPTTNLPLRLGGRWIEADCVWRKQRLIVELDGHASHHTRAAFEDDRARDRALTIAGWRVIRITWRQLRGEPAALARDLRRALALESTANLRRA
jgi:hypothetical protein